MYAEKCVDKTSNIHNYEFWNDFEKDIFNNYLENKDKYIEEISQLLAENWTIDRLNVVVLALLLTALSEYYAAGTAYQVLIQQTVVTSKKYCEDNDYKFLNALLDNYWKKHELKNTETTTN